MHWQIIKLVCLGTVWLALTACYQVRVVPILQSEYDDPATGSTIFDVLVQKISDDGLSTAKDVSVIIEINGDTYPMRRIGKSMFSTYRFVNKNRAIPHDGEYRIRYTVHITRATGRRDADRPHQDVIHYPASGCFIRRVGAIRWNASSNIRYSQSITSGSFGRMVVFDYVFADDGALGVQDRYESVTIENHGQEALVLQEPLFHIVDSDVGACFSVINGHFPKTIPPGHGYSFPVRYRRDMHGKRGVYRATAIMSIPWTTGSNDKCRQFGPIAIDATFHRRP